MRSLFVMDPLASLHLAGDSTFVVMRECSDRGHPVWWCTPDDLYVLDGRACARAERVVTTEAPPHFQRGAREELDLGDLDVVWMRKDPPFDMAYVFATYVLDLAARDALVVNDPAGLKPWDGNGGRGVVVVHKGDRNLPALLELMTGQGRDFVIAQAYLPGVAQGDKRILLFDGEPVGALLRIPGERDHRANLHVGGRAVACDIDARDEAICRAIGPELKKHGQLFVGIDVIQGMLTEINVTSPTGLRAIAALDGRHLEGDLVDRVEAKVAARRSRA